MKKLVLVLASCGCVVASAAEYTLTVESGEQTLDAAMAAAYSGTTLAAGDTIVKKGAGTLKDAEAALALDKKLVFDVQEGAFVENVARKSSTYRVADGAAVEVSVDLYKIGTSSAVAHFELNGSGTADRPGALYLSTNSQASDQFIEVALKGDAVIYCNGKDVNFASWSDTSAAYNVFKLNGYSDSSSRRRIIIFAFGMPLPLTSPARSSLTVAALRGTVAVRSTSIRRRRPFLA